MGSLPIPSTPLQVLLDFVQVDSGQSTLHPLAGSAGLLYRTLLLQQVDDASRPALLRLLTTPLQQLFDELWTELNQSPDLSQRPATLVASGIKSAESRAYAINVTLPTKGTLYAIAGNVSSGIRDMFPAQQPGHQLTLTYSLPGVSATCNVTTNSIFGSWADPRVRITFDARFLVEIAVPSDSSVPLGVNTVFATDNVQTSGDTFFSDIEIGLVSAWQKLSQILTSSTGGGGTPGTQVNVSVPALLDQLSGAFTVASRFGFRQLDVRVNENPLPGTDPGTTVEFVLTHPQKAGPILKSESADPFERQLAMRVDPSQVHPGDSVTARCSNISHQRAAFAAIYAPPPWYDREMEFEFGVTATGDVPPTSTTRILLTRSSADFIMPNLQVSTSYGIRARQYDIPMVVASEWGPWLYITTASSDQCQFAVLAADGALLTSSTQTLDNSGTAMAVLTIPPEATPGNAQVQVTVPDQGSFSVPLTIVATGLAFTPIIFGIDSAGLPVSAFTVDPRGSTVYGRNWPPFDIEFYLDSTDGPFLGTAWGSPPYGTFAVRLPFREAGDRVETHEVVAIQRTLGHTAKCTVYYPGPPR
jgi:hypothetical protein